MRRAEIVADPEMVRLINDFLWSKSDRRCYLPGNSNSMSR